MKHRCDFLRQRGVKQIVQKLCRELVLRRQRVDQQVKMSATVEQQLAPMGVQLAQLSVVDANDVVLVRAKVVGQERDGIVIRQQRQ